MASERDIELLDDYISNRLTGADKEYIEQKLQQDPDLRSEYTIQQQIASGIRKARAMELKKLLNSIPTPSLTGRRPAYTKAAGAGIVILISLSLLFYLMNTSDQEIASVATEEVQVTEPQEQESGITETAEETSEETPNAEPDADKTETAQAKKSDRTNSAQKQNASKLDVFDPSEENETTEEQTIPVVTESIGKEHRVSEMVVETNETNKKYSFHYQINNDRLVLYGSFEKDLYEILEFFANEKRTVFLFYKDNYYLLNASGGKITPLIPVNDPLLLKKLKEYRTGDR